MLHLANFEQLPQQEQVPIKQDKKRSNLPLIGATIGGTAGFLKSRPTRSIEEEVKEVEDFAKERQKDALQAGEQINDPQQDFEQRKQQAINNRKLAKRVPLALGTLGGGVAGYLTGKLIGDNN